MTGTDEIPMLERAHALFAGSPELPANAEPAHQARQATVDPAAVAGSSLARYRQTAARSHKQLTATADVDARLTSIVSEAAAEHSHAQRTTRVILDAAHADAAPAADTPMGARELVARRASRARATHHVLASSHRGAARRRAMMRALGYSRSHAGAPRAGDMSRPGKANEHGLQRYTKLINRAVSAAFPQIHDIGGVRADSLKWHPQGLALDIMLPNWNTPAGHDLGNQIVNFLIRNRQKLGVAHMIYRQHMIEANGSSSMMEDRGGVTANHFDHVHVASIGGGY